ncbi:hypothetical protein QYE76_012556 [Lolium multiflorum]|uniref:Uncharacterized protein n=1 Tax=Lolium multiflorum TaxID=4521 RepID=A0AAD8U161_LOLMU|nr:hypothetical protein QYE76_012556 [Lolium multiflorum]
MPHRFKQNLWGLVGASGRCMVRGVVYAPLACPTAVAEQTPHMHGTCDVTGRVRNMSGFRKKKKEHERWIWITGFGFHLRRAPERGKQIEMHAIQFYSLETQCCSRPQLLL